MTGIMLDFESMAVGMKPALTELGAVAFDESNFEIFDTFHVGITLGSSIVAGLEVHQSTVEFWQGQNEAAKESFKESQLDAYNLDHVLRDFMDFINRIKSSPSRPKINSQRNILKLNL